MSDPADKNPYGGSLGGDLPEHYTYNPETLNKKRSPFWEKVDIHNRILYIIFLVLVWYILICGTLEEILMGNFSPYPYILDGVSDEATRNALSFIMEIYLTTVVSFIVIFLYTGISKRNRFIFKSFLPGHARNRISKLTNGLLVGFIMNFGCILCALLNGDIKLFYNFTLNQIPLFLFALVCVFIQSSSEELWCRGFMYERINVRYPLWVAILINGIFFGALHTMNPGVSALPIIDIIICGISFSLAKWYTGSIWFPMGIHTAWNFTQNFLFGLPNSGLVSEASVFGLDAASATDSVVYNVAFGVEGAYPAVAADAILGIVCLLLAAKKGRLGELTQSIQSQSR